MSDSTLVAPANFVHYDKDPSAEVNFTFDWADWLGVGETISSYTLVLATGITNLADSNTTTTVVVKVGAGVDLTQYNINCEIVTSGGQTDQRTIVIDVKNR